MTQRKKLMDLRCIYLIKEHKATMALVSIKIYSSEKLAAYHVDMYIFKKKFGQQKNVKRDCLMGVSMQKY